MNTQELFLKEKGAKAYIAKYGHYLPDGREVCDPTPMAIPVGCRKPLTLQEQLARLTAFDLLRAERSWTNGDEQEEDLLDPEDPDDAFLLAQKTPVNGSQSVSKGVPATPVADTNQSVAQEPENGEEPDLL